MSRSSAAAVISWITRFRASSLGGDEGDDDAAMTVISCIAFPRLILTSEKVICVQPVLGRGTSSISGVMSQSLMLAGRSTSDVNNEPFEFSSP